MNDSLDKNVKTRWPRLQLVVAILFSGVAVGCGGSSGPKLATVSGTVTLNGDPVTGVNVTFIPRQNGSPSYGSTDEDGNYQLLFTHQKYGAELGSHDVLIEQPEPETDDSGKVLSPKPIVAVPDKFRHRGTLTAEVSSGRNKVNFELSRN